MPDTSTLTPVVLPSTSALKPDPQVTLYFSGLILMAYRNQDKINRMEAGVHSTAPDHQFKIIVEKITRTGISIFETGFDPTSSGAGTIEFNLFNDQGGPANPSVNFYQNNPFDRDRFSKFFGNDDFGPVSIDDLRDFRWVIDFESHHLHNRPLNVDHTALTPRIHINNGTFYTARRTSTTFNRIRVENGDPKICNFGGVAHVIGVNVHYDATQYARLKISDEIILTLRYEAGTHYKVAFINDPTDQDDPDHNDFKEYYSVIDVDEAEQFNLCPFGDEPEDCLERNKSQTTQNKRPDPPSGGTDRVPCSATFLGHKNGLPSDQ